MIPKTTTGRPRILYVEDDSALAQLTQRKLSRNGFEVDTVSDGKKGLEQLTVALYDAVLLDYHMPNMSGMDVLKVMMTNPASPPAIMVSGVDDLEVAVQAMRLGAADYILKEISDHFYELLVVTINKVIDKQRLIQEQKRSDRALRESEARFRAVTQSAGDAIVAADESGIVRFWNHGAQKIFGYSEQEMLGHSLLRLIPERYQQVHLNSLKFICSTGRRQLEGQIISVPGLNKNGDEVPLDITIGTWKVGGKHHFSAILRDVSERNKLEETLKQTNERLIDNEEKLKEALKIAKLGHWHWNVETHSLSMSEEACYMLGWPFEGLPKTYEWFVQSVHPQDRDKFYKEAKKALVQGGLSFDHRIVCSDGHVLVVHEEGKSLLDDEGRVVQIIGTIQDITEQKAREDLLERIRREAESANRAKSDFLATMSHEIRTPMNGILGMAELLLDGNLLPPARDYAETIQRSGNSLLTIINDILDFSKIEAGKLKLETIPFAPQKIVDDVYRLFKAYADKKAIGFQVQGIFGLPVSCEGDATRVQQVLVNLISNAIKFTENGEVNLSVDWIPLATDNGKIRFQIKDSGIGMTPNEIKKLFRAFEQADSSTTRRFGGTGLGLSIVKRLVTLMNGDITVESNIGKGSLFTVTLPFTRPFESKYPKTEEKVVDHSVDLPVDARLLVVEDDAINRAVLRGMLKKMGYEPDMARNGQEAVDILKTKTFDAILMDCQMPIMDGFTASRLFRQWEEKNASLSRTPIIAITANVLKESEVSCLASGMDDYVSKPISLKGLRVVLSRWLSTD